MLRVLWLSQVRGVGGGESVVLRGLSRSTSLDITVAAYPAVASFGSSLGFRTIQLELPRAHRITHAARLLRGARRVGQLARSERCDLIYANGTRAIPYAVAARAVGGPPVLAHHHVILTHRVTGASGAFTRAVDRYADVIVVPSNAASTVFRARRKVRVIPTGIAVDTFATLPSRDRARDLLGLPRDVPVAGMIARADPVKDIPGFIKMCGRVSREIREARFVLVGGPSSVEEAKHYEYVRGLAARSPADVVLTGIVDDPRPALAAIDVLVLPGAPEGLPTTAIEALASGVPVVGYRHGGLPEVVDDGVTGVLVEPGDATALDAAVLGLLSDPARRRELGRAGVQVARRRFSFARFAEKLENAVGSAVST